MVPSRDTVGVLTIAVLAVLGVGLVAATISSTYTTALATGGSGGSGPGGPVLPGDGETVDPSDDTDDVPIDHGEGQDAGDLPSVCVPILTEPGVILGVVAAFALIVAMAYRQFELLGAAFTVYIVGLPVTLGYALVTQCPQGAPPGGGWLLGQGGSPLPGPGPESGATTVPPALLVGLFAFAALGAVVTLLSARGDETVEPPAELPEEDDPSLSQFAAAAGDAADRIEASQASVDNAVYRAWSETTDLLDVGSPRATTAGEFADAAVAAGIDEADVARLTALFEEVRYGDMDPEPREALALETLRRIEAAYGDAADVADVAVDAEGADPVDDTDAE